MVDIREVAKAAGVSIATVSDALNDRGRMRGATRERVRSAAAELGYAPNHFARGLRARRSDTVVLLGDEIVTTPWAGRMVAGVQNTAAAYGSLVLILNTNLEPETEVREIEMLKQRLVDGVIYATMYHRKVAVPSALTGIPVVLLDASADDSSHSSVVPDEVAGGQAAAEVLLAAGHRRIGFINNDEDTFASHGRLRGFTDALTSAGLTPDPRWIVWQRPIAAGGYLGGRQLLASADRPSAIFCFNDRVAMGCYQAATELEIAIPEDLSVVGFDNAEIIADALRPGLTSVALPHYEMGAWAVHELYSQIDASTRGSTSTPVHLVLPGPVVQRASVASPRESAGAHRTRHTTQPATSAELARRHAAD